MKNPGAKTVKPVKSAKSPKEEKKSRKYRLNQVLEAMSIAEDNAAYRPSNVRRMYI